MVSHVSRFPDFHNLAWNAKEEDQLLEAVGQVGQALAGGVLSESIKRPRDECSKRIDQILNYLELMGKKTYRRKRWAQKEKILLCENVKKYGDELGKLASCVDLERSYAGCNQKFKSMDISSLAIEKLTTTRLARSRNCSLNHAIELDSDGEGVDTPMTQSSETDSDDHMEIQSHKEKEVQGEIGRLSMATSENWMEAEALDVSEVCNVEKPIPPMPRGSLWSDGADDLLLTPEWRFSLENLNYPFSQLHKH